MPSRWRHLCAAALLLSVCDCGDRAANTESLNPLASRTAEGRFTDLAWAPLRPANAAVGSRAVAAAVGVLKANQGRDATAAQRRAVSYAVLGKFQRAVEEISAATAITPSDAAIHSDAAAAWLALSSAADTPSRLVDALRETDAALAIDRGHAAALFNRALILEHLGLRRHAARAWRAYLQVDALSPWSDEARERLFRNARQSEAMRFASIQTSLERAATSGDQLAVRDIVARFPQQTRAWGEVEYLGRWAEAFLHGEEDVANRQLRIAAAIGEALVQVKGEWCLYDAVQAIVKTDKINRQIHDLAEGHDAYRRGRLLFKGLRVADADPLFRRALGLFESGQSPMSLVATHYSATCAYEMGRISEARDRLAALIAGIERHTPGYKALRAHAMQELGLCEAASGHWAAALEGYENAARSFASLAETGNEGFATDLLAEAWNFLGQREVAWRTRIKAVQRLEEAGTIDRVERGLASAIDSELTRGDRLGALALLGLQVDRTASTDVPRLVDSLIRRAQIAAEVGQDAAARRDIASAQAKLATIPDPAVKRQLAARFGAAEASVLSRSDPRRAIVSINLALSSDLQVSKRVYLPVLLLERARAHRRLADFERAESDYDAAIEALDNQRESVNSVEVRSRVFDSLSELFAEAIDVAAQRSPRRTFELIEGTRARGLVASLERPGTRSPAPASAAAIQAKLPRDTAIIEYGVAPSGIVTMVITRDGIRLLPERVDADTAARVAERLRKAIDDRAQHTLVDTPLRQLYDLFIRPAAIPTNVTRLVVVPDRFLQTLPFPAFRDRRSGAYLVEKYEIVIAPSATFWARASRPPVRGDAMLIVANPMPGDDAESLPGAQMEAAAIAKTYPRATILTGAEATAERFIREAPRYDMIHFGGHGIAGSRDVQPALIFAPEGGKRTRMWAPDLARLDLRRTHLVVLAGCDTFHGDTAPVEGMPSIVRAFLQAGVPTVIGTLWRIDDDTAATVFASFYRHLLGGLSPEASLRAAQIEALRSGDVRAWGGVEAIGTTREMRESIRPSLKGT